MGRRTFCRALVIITLIVEEGALRTPGLARIAAREIQTFGEEREKDSSTSKFVCCAKKLARICSRAAEVVRWSGAKEAHNEAS